MGAMADAKELYEKIYSTGCVQYSLDAQEVIREWCDKKEQLLLEQQKLIGKLEAKVTAYEAIISNSNFSMAIPKEEKSEKNCPDESKEESKSERDETYESTLKEIDDYIKELIDIKKDRGE